MGLEGGFIITEDGRDADADSDAEMEAEDETRAGAGFECLLLVLLRNLSSEKRLVGGSTGEKMRSVNISLNVMDYADIPFFADDFFPEICVFAEAFPLLNTPTVGGGFI